MAGDEVLGPQSNEHGPGVRWKTISSDNNDKFAKPDGLRIGQKGTPTFVTSYRFITHQAPRRLAMEPEGCITLSGQITGLGLKSD